MWYVTQATYETFVYYILLHKKDLLSAQVVTANGEVVTASLDENPGMRWCMCSCICVYVGMCINVFFSKKTRLVDLLWGLQGGGGNFGVVASFKFQLHEIGENGNVGYSLLSFELKNAKKVFAFYADWALSAPRQISAFCFWENGALVIMFVYNGKLEDMKNIIAPFVDLEPYER